MITTIVKCKTIKYATKLIRMDKLDSLMMASQLNITEVSSQDQTRIYKNEASDKS